MVLGRHAHAAEVQHAAVVGVTLTVHISRGVLSVKHTFKDPPTVGAGESFSWELRRGWYANGAPYYACPDCGDRLPPEPSEEFSGSCSCPLAPADSPDDGGLEGA